MRINEYGQPVGDHIKNYEIAKTPNAIRLEGKHCFLEKVDFDNHFNSFFKNIIERNNPKDWTYMSIEKPSDKNLAAEWFESLMNKKDPYVFAIVRKQDLNVVGLISLMRINPLQSNIEVGSIIFSDLIKRSRLATEVHYILATYVFETLKYRRYEWKCDSLNEPSKKAAIRIGFTYEGMFRNALVYKGRNRDTTWFSIIDSEWHKIKESMQAWLSDENFNLDGNQIEKLESFR